MGLLCLTFVGVMMIAIATPNRYLNEGNSSQLAARMANTVAIIICSGVAFGFGLAAVAAWHRNANTVVLLTVVNVLALLALDPIEKTILKDVASFGIAYAAFFLLLAIAGGMLFWQTRRGAVMPRFHLAVTSRPTAQEPSAVPSLPARLHARVSAPTTVNPARRKSSWMTTNDAPNVDGPFETGANYFSAAASSFRKRYRPQRTVAGTIASTNNTNPRPSRRSRIIRSSLWMVGPTRK